MGDFSRISPWLRTDAETDQRLPRSRIQLFGRDGCADKSSFHPAYVHCKPMFRLHDLSQEQRSVSMSPRHSSEICLRMTHGPRHRLNLDRGRGHQQQLLDGLLPRRRMELGFKPTQAILRQVYQPSQVGCWFAMSCLVGNASSSTYRLCLEQVQLGPVSPPAR